MKRPYRQKDLGAKTRTMAETMKEYHPVKYKDVNIGQVTAVQLASDSSRVEVAAKIAKSADPVELPVTPSELTDIEHKVVGILAKLDTLPYDAIGADLTKALVSLDQTLKDADKAVNRLDAEVTGELKPTLEALRRTIAARTDRLSGASSRSPDPGQDRGDTLMRYLIALAACASPASRFYTLTAATTPAATSSDLSVVVGPVSVPAV